ncbi:heterokaryon incompatibility protein-domain-containing protein [Emericellopsis atlantica]|uniref:Heterokaryon incompatibility protein-domain-containing protein n=1 Tax=Emericellopsis atlantica TaxID=2614577 RepID=A0A9P7ZPW5_9HYPO|nr:heterokaryon incompatibility protein-domain-containing protein [Emericellopsis atlantica]KAG9256000.1 heterokaryon incompatibility protein-domain-containing protein [Emericellopsis atlantica]
MLDDGIELQVALDAMAAGDMEPLKHYFANLQGVDPATVTLRASPWRPPPEAAEDTSNYNFEYIGKVDNVQDPNDEASTLPERSLEKPTVRFDTTSTPFTYTPLEKREFRLMRLAPPDAAGVTHEIEVKTFPLDEAPPFFCLSYFLPTLVAQNLYHALRTCFNRFSKSWLWADGLCINQGDLHERSQQVMLMGEIYSKASMVLAHPGHYSYGLSDSEAEVESTAGQPTNPDNVAALHASGQLDLGEVPDAPFDAELDASTESAQVAISIMTYLTRIWDASPDFEIKSDAEWRKHRLPDPNTNEGAAVWTRLIDFWRVDWFCRAWVLQELVLAKKVVILYGMAVFSLDAVMEFWGKAQTRGLPRLLRLGVLADQSARIVHLSPASSLQTLIEQRKTPSEEEQSGDEGSKTLAEPPITKQPSHFLELLAITRMNKATDNRDKIYALLGLVDDAISQSIVPDYSAKNPVHQLYIDVARKFVEAGLGPRLLHLAGVTAQTPDLPTWVPDWTRQTRSRMTPDLYSCMGTTKPTIRIIDTEGEKPKLVVRGVVLSTVKTVSLAWRYYSHDEDESTFSGFKGKPDVKIPPFNDEDGRNVVLSMALEIEAGSGAKRYAEEGFETALARTLAMDRSWRGERIARGKAPGGEQPRRDVAAEFLDAFAAFRAFYKRGLESPDDENMPGARVHQTFIFKWLLIDMDQAMEDELQQRMVPYTVAMQEASRGRRFAMLSGKSIRQKEADKAAGDRRYEMDDRAFIASVPYDAEKQDIVVMLEGFNAPFVLRKTSVEGEYQLVGDCYVHGVMDGELLRKAEEAGVQLRDDQVVYGDDGQKFGVRVPDGFGTVQEFTIC